LSLRATMRVSSAPLSDGLPLLQIMDQWIVLPRCD
jgi:hypothetical protein